MADKIGIGIIGAGGIATSSHRPALTSVPELCTLLTVCDADGEKARIAAEKFGAAHWTDNVDQALAMGGVDAVVVATPNRFHYDHTMAALRAGKHVLCEKPLAISSKHSGEMVALAREKGLTLQVGLQLRYTAQAAFLKKFCDDGKMGDIYYARAQTLRRRGVPSWGVFIDKELQGGGPLVDVGVHILDLTLFLMGYPKPVSASGVTFNKLGKDPTLYNRLGDYDRSKFTVEDLAAGLIRFENGAAISLEASFMANTPEERYQSELWGTGSGALIKGFLPEVKILREEDKQIFEMVPQNLPTVESPHAEQVKAFVAAVHGGKPTPIPGEQGHILCAICDAIYKSADSGKEEAVTL